MTRAFCRAMDCTLAGQWLGAWIGSPAFFRTMALSMILAVHVALNLIPFWWAFVLSHSDAFHTSRIYGWFMQHWPHTSIGWSLLFLVGGICGLPGLLPPVGRTFWLRNVWWRLIGTGLLAFVLVWMGYVLAIVTPTVATGPGVLVLCGALGVVSMIASVGYSIGMVARPVRGTE